MDVNYLNKTVWARLAPSKIHGIGVFAIRAIPKGIKITDHSVHNIRDARPFKIKMDDFDKIHLSIRELILDHWTFRQDQDVFVIFSPNAEVCLQSFMNHSDDPNTDGEHSIRDIAEGEEITEDYSVLHRKEGFHALTRSHYHFVK